MFDLVIRGDRVVTPQGVDAFDLAIRGEKIVAVAAAGTFGPETTARLVDARGKIVMPGGIDPHVHCSWALSYLDGTPFLSDPPSVVSRAALYGGTTTLIDFARWNPGASVQSAVELRDTEWAGKCYCDYAYHVLIKGALPLHIFGELAEAIRAGYPTIKIFTTNSRPGREGFMVDFGDIWEVCRVAAREGGLCVMHGEDNDIVMHMYDKLIREGRVGFENMAEVHNALSESLSFRRIIGVAESVPGAALYFMHVSAETGVQAIREARARGLPVYGETLHQYLMYTQEDYKRPNGQIYHTYPSLKSKADQAALWAGTEDGVIHTVGTDEICCTLAVKVQGKRIDNATGGNAGVEPRLAVMYTEMVGRRGYSLQKFVDLTSTNAAKVMGLYPRKGVLASGSDADIAILDPSNKLNVTSAMLHETDYSPWEGCEVDAWPSMTILRGKVVVDAGRFLGEPTDGQYLYRRIPEEIRSRPML
jgi:dihydropyrimidinase